MFAKSSAFLALLAVLPVVSAPAVAAQSQEERGLTELRNTVVNLLQALVERGVMTREQAEGLVKNAQDKAATEAAAVAAQDAAESNAVRVPYIPEIVKDEIRKQVTADLAPQVAKEVVEQSRQPGWANSFLPDWLSRVRLSGDVRLREEGDLFGTDNTEFGYLDFNSVNAKGGINKAGLDAFANTTQDRYRMRARGRIGLDAELGSGWTAGARITTGNLMDPVSTNQTLGNTGARYQTGFDLLYAGWAGSTSNQRHSLSLVGGRIANPWQSHDLVWDPDLNFEGVAGTYRLGLTREAAASHVLFLTLGAFPIQEVELSKDDKWLYGSQLGLDWHFDNGSRAHMGAAYYYYRNIVGKRNQLDSTLLDYTAPQFLQTGNTLFDIRNDKDNDTNLFALATNYHLLDGTIGFDFQLTPSYKISLNGEFVRNIGYDRALVLLNTGLDLKPRDSAYLAELAFGKTQLAQAGDWRVAVGYRYLEADSMLDAFADSDFHLGGTNARGYTLSADFAFTERVFARLRYLSANEIDGNQVGIDVLQLDLNTRF